MIRGILIMDINNIEKSINNAAASVSMEGFLVTAEHKEMCKQMLLGNTTLEQCLKTIKNKYSEQ